MSGWALLKINEISVSPPLNTEHRQVWRITMASSALRSKYFFSLILEKVFFQAEASETIWNSGNKTFWYRKRQPVRTFTLHLPSQSRFSTQPIPARKCLINPLYNWRCLRVRSTKVQLTRLLQHLKKSALKWQRSFFAALNEWLLLHTEN